MIAVVEAAAHWDRFGGKYQPCPESLRDALRDYEQAALEHRLANTPTTPKT